jgi:hypothetical protein
LLPVPYFHVVFTLPEGLNAFCLRHSKEAYNLLFQSVWQTLRQFGGNRHLKMGMIVVLHTWGQTLSLHPHLHCIVPGGGIDRNGKWHNICADGKFLFPVKALSKVFRAKYVSQLRKTALLAQESIEPLFSNSWVVYAKRPFGGPEEVVEYLGRYTHKVAISNNRILSYENNRVSFSYKDYRQGGCKKEMELDDSEFIRRFALHILPSGFVRIRHYGILSSSSKTTLLPRILQQFPAIEVCLPERRKVQLFDPTLCPYCMTHTMVIVERLLPRGPPDWLIGKRPAPKRSLISKV